MKNQGVLKDLEVLIHSGSRHLGIIRYLCKIYDCTVAQRCDPEKSAECRNVANGAFSHYLLLQVQTCVRLEIGNGIIGKVDRGGQSSLDSTVQLESFPQFPAGQGV